MKVVSDPAIELAAILRHGRRTGSTMQEKASLVFFGSLFLILGLGGGYFMLAHPGGLNPEWPLVMALMAVSVFTFGGLHLLAVGLGYPRVSSILLQVILLALLGVFNWAAFFTTHFQCTQTVSFLGVEVVKRIPSEESCRNGMKVMVGTIDLVIVLGLVAFAKQKLRQSRSEPPPTR